jgi:hypothetical protein
MRNQFKVKIVSFLIFIILLSLYQLSFAQISSYQWANRLSSTLLDESFSIAIDNDGNCYVTGIFTGTAVLDDTTLVSRGKTDIFLAKYNPSGLLSWVKQVGGKEDDDGYAVYTDNDGHCYLAGSFSDTAYFENDTLICFDTNIFYFDIFLAKYTLDGDLLWVKRAGEQYWDEAFGICTDASGQIYITGSYWGTAKFDNITLTGLYGLGATDGFDVFIAKYDTAGNALWANRMVEKGWDRGSDVAVDLSGNCYVTGGFQTALLFGGFGGPSLTATGGEGDEDIFLVKYNPAGNFIWKTSAGGGKFDQARAITVDEENNVYITGVFNDTASFDSTKKILSFGFNDIFIAKYDSTGQVLWAKGAGSTGDDGGNDVITDREGNVFICGYFGETAHFDNINIEGGGLFIAKYNPEGEAYWIKQISEPTNLAKSLVIDRGGDLIVTGVYENSATFGSTVLNGQGQTDVFITKLDTMTVTNLPFNAPSRPHRFYLSQNYPNPFNPRTVISWQLASGSDVKLTVYNLLGQKVVTLVSERQKAGHHQVEWDATDFASGIYYCKIVAGEFQAMMKMILIK